MVVYGRAGGKRSQGTAKADLRSTVPCGELQALLGLEGSRSRTQLMVDQSGLLSRRPLDLRTSMIPPEFIISRSIFGRGSNLAVYPLESLVK
jgi:hypothetical protein